MEGKKISERTNNQNKIIAELEQKTINLKIEEIFWKNRLEMAREETISLLVDLTRRKVILEIKGIPLRECDIINYKICNTLVGYKQDKSMLSWLGIPFTLKEEWATIPKAPITVREIPKNRDEALEMLTLPIPIDTSDVYTHYHFDRDLSIIIRKARETFSIDWFNGLFEDDTLLSNLYCEDDEFGQILVFMPPKKKKWIEIELSNKHARAIYRALPKNARLAICL